MKQTLKVLMTLSLVASLFVAGFAGTVAADENEQEIDQEANAEVSQAQAVAQGNSNVQGAAVAGAAFGDATAVQYNEQENNNAQIGIAEAENNAEQNQWINKHKKDRKKPPWVDA
ncbi:hypothetical protein [Haladaptatus caseinilyticus]|uniref:hypothetical protein n=1 Tax=Haladaptatus caseinilyticus TaxID=2993314 RepID=UPI00224AAACA|nr:hypothetical protein [Haladaptatus caseinilyticus]